ncbi:hypothetical protein ABKV19_005520 [Rosa sericea]
MRTVLYSLLPNWKLHLSVSTILRLEKGKECLYQHMKLKPSILDENSKTVVYLSILNFPTVLSKKPPAPHRVVPDYLLNATTKEASKRVKLANLGRRGFKKKFKEDKDPLKSFSAQLISWRPTP